MPEQRKTSNNDDMATKVVTTQDSNHHENSFESSALKPPTEVTKHWAKKHRTLIASSASSLASTFVGQPLDTIKTRMQGGSYITPRKCAQDLWSKDGYRGFFRGALAPLLSITLNRTSTFTVYQKAKYKYSDAIGRLTGGEEPLVVVNRPGSVPTLATMACFGAAGGSAGVFAATVATPFELIKSYAQLSGIAGGKHTSMDDPQQRARRKEYDNKGTIKTAKLIVKQRGPMALYTGFRLVLIRDIIGSSVYFSTYESIKQLLVKYSKSDSPTSPGAVALAGGLCGVISWACVYPLDTVKLRYQQSCLTKTKEQVVKMPKVKIFKPEVYKGLSVSITRTCLINTVFFSSFEYLKKQINALPDHIAEPVE